jgi:hypothetical protein
VDHNGYPTHGIGFVMVCCPLVVARELDLVWTRLLLMVDPGFVCGLVVGFVGSPPPLALVRFWCPLSVP